MTNFPSATIALNFPRSTAKNFVNVSHQTKNPKSIASTVLVSEALDVLEDNKITQLMVIDNGTYKGVLHLHDILKEGIV